MEEIVKLEPQPVTVDMVKWHKFAVEAETVANAIVVTCDEEEAMAIDSRTKIKEFGKQVEDARKSHVRPFNDFVDRINGMFKPLSGAIDAASGTIGNKLMAYKHEKDLRRQEEERKRQEEYRKKLAEEEARVAAENKKRMEEAARLQAIENERAAKERREAAAIAPPPLVEVSVAPPPVILPAANTTVGSYGKATTVKRWVATVTDRKAFLSYVATVDQTSPMYDAIEIKQGALNKEAVRLKGRELYPGVSFKQEESLR